MADKSGYGGYAVGWLCLAPISTNIAQLNGAGGPLWRVLSAGMPVWRREP
jgi:hypothetical protein